MKLARQISLTLGVLACLVIAGEAAIRVRVEWDRGLEDARTDLQLIGRALASAVTRVAGVEGINTATALLAEAGQERSGTQLRWIWLEGEGELQVAPLVPRSALSGLTSGAQQTFELEAHGVPTLVVYTAAPAAGRLGALEMSQTLAERRSLTRRTITRVVATSAVLAALFLGSAVMLGNWLVGRPVGALAELSRRLAQGDLGARVRVTTRDELGQLGDALNQMAASLQQARAEVEREARARVAAVENLRHADRLSTVGKLAAGIAHELGTPLNVVDGRAKLIAGGLALGDEAVRNARIISEQVSAMTRIIRQLLDFARRGAPTRRQEALAALAGRTVELLRPLAGKRGVTLRNGIDAELRAPVDADALQQVFTNLLMNAIQASSPGGEVLLTSTREERVPPEGGAPGTFACVEVADRGVGIAAEVLPRIFEPFFTTKGVGEGTGLGLSVSHGIISDHGGWLAAESQPGVGSRFRIYLPLEERG